MTLKSFLRMRLFVSLVGILWLWRLSSVLDFAQATTKAAAPASPTTPPEYAVITSVHVAAGKTPDFENCLKTEVLPHYKMVDEFKRHYPYVFCEGGATISGSFEEEDLGERNRA